MRYSVNFPGGTVQYALNGNVADIQAFAGNRQVFIITDSNIAALYPELVSSCKSVVIEASEEHKKLKTVNIIAEKLLELEAHRETLLVGIGGGLVTDITGFVASVYMRGIAFGFVPTTILGMVDAAIGGKNGVNFGLHKNMLGTFRQPEFILYDTAFFSTLPDAEWSNGFAEVIKYGCIFDEVLFEELEKHELDYYKQNPETLNNIIRKCVDWKNKTVLEDETEKGNRKLLNFGHTAGHAVETLYNLPHGQAISIGMLIACIVSENVTGLSSDVYNRLAAVLKQYKLPVSLTLETGKLMEILIMDKKRNNDTINFIVLNKIGEASVQPLPFDAVRQAIDKFSDAGNH